MAKKEVKKKVEKKAAKAPLTKSSGKASAKASPAKSSGSKTESSKSKPATASAKKNISEKAAPVKAKAAPSKSSVLKVETKEKPQSTKLSTSQGTISKSNGKPEVPAVEVKKEVVVQSMKPKATKDKVSHKEEDAVVEPTSSSSKKSKKYEAATEEEARWLELKDKYKSTKAAPYKMSEAYAEKTPIDHKVLGWGFILSVMNDRLEVLFQSGIKQLISNYKSNN